MAERGEAKVLVIVESPAKARTIEGYLGPGYLVLASMGHLIDLPKSRLGIAVEGDFEPEYLTVRGKAKLLKELRRAAAKASRVLLASDNDREGEAIASLVGSSLGLDGDVPVERIVFNEITPRAIREAVAAPRGLDAAKVEAQKARRVLDRLVGYNLSPLLWKKVKNGLSAGRVQSVALRLICEREREVESHLPEERWGVEADFRKGRGSFSGELVSLRGEPPRLADEAAAAAVVAGIEGVLSGGAVVVGIRESEELVAPEPPFTTSTLLQAAADRLGFTSKKTMQVAQQLYEGVEVGGTLIGLVTYMRSDSARVADEAVGEARAWIRARHPAELPESPNAYAAGGRAEDAHEAIRPTDVARSPELLRDQLTRDQRRLYSLVWERFTASQMTPAKVRRSEAELASGDAVFRVSSSRVVERGFLKVVKPGSPREELAESPAPGLRVGESIRVERARAERRFGEGPARYTEASLVKVLEERGIGRPSTYAPIISVLLERYYVVREDRQLVPTALGRMIGEILSDYFPEVVDVGFTAAMEARLDEVEEGRAEWSAAIRDFYGPFKERVDRVMEDLGSYRGVLDEPTELACEKCGKPMVKKLGRYGFFLACSGFPGCRSTRSIPLAACPKCGGDVVARRRAKGRGRVFYGCSRYPDCGFVTYSKPTGSSCPKCGWFLVEKFDRRTGPRKACVNPDCDYMHSRGEGEEA